MPKAASHTKMYAKKGGNWGKTGAAARAAASIVRQAAASSRRQAYPNPGAGVFGRYESRAYRRAALETKTVDFQFTGAYVAGGAYTPDTQPFQQLLCNSGTACVQAVNLAQQGTGISQRDGNKISMKSLRIRMALNIAALQANTATSNVRVMLIYDRQPNAAYIASNAILGESLQSNTIGTGTMFSNLNPNFFERFRVLMDKQQTLPPFDNGVIGSTGLTGPTALETFKIDEFIPLKDLETLFNGTANPMTIAQVTTGALLLVCFGDSADGAAPFGWKGTVRLRFRDN